MSISDEQLLEWNQLGLIPGPDEEELDYLRRVDYCLKIEDELCEELGDKVQKELPQGALDQVDRLFGITPTWVPVYYSNEKLMPWHGGCAWIFQQKEDSPTAAIMQLRKGVYKKKRYLKIYHVNELIAHELVHIGRMMFEEPKYEEVFAYKTSKSLWRRWLGPIVQSSGESMLFLLALLMMVVLDYFLLSYNMFSYVMLTKLIPLSLIAVGVIRLQYRHCKLKKCLRKLKQVFGDKALHIAYRLTDKEIDTFRKLDPDAIKRRVEYEAKSSLRWQLLNCYTQS